MERRTRRYYKYCIVPMCENNSKTAPNKIYFHIPKDVRLRKKWCKVMRRDNVSCLSSLYCCEDHFDIEKDTENYMKYKIMALEHGHKMSLLLKKDVLPHIFHCQKDRLRLPPERKVALKRKRQALIKEALANADLSETGSSMVSISQIDVSEADPSTATIIEIDLSEADPSTPSIPSYMDIEFNTPKIAEATCGNSDSNTSLGVSQVIEEDISEPATVQTSQDDPVDVDENTQTSIPDGSMDYSIDLFKCYTIISNVYCYLQREYISLESQLGAFCDVSVLSNTLERTAAATGVTQGEVEIALHATALQSDQPSKPEKTYSSTGVRRSCNILRNKRRSKALEEDKSEDSVRPAKRKATRGRPKKKTVPNKPSDEEQLPFPAPIQLQVHGVMRTECKIEPVDEPPSMEDDPLEAGSSSQCGKSEEIEIKTEPVDYESPDIKDDPLALEWSQTTLEEPSVPPDMTHTEVKSEHVDHDYANMYCGLSNNAKKSPDINPKSHLQ